MGKKSKAKRENEGVLNIDGASVKDLFVQMATPKGVILTSTTPQMKDLGPDGYRYTMWGLNKDGNRCLVVLSADRDGISQKENWQSKYPTMKTVVGDVVAVENQKFATKKMTALCAKEGFSVSDKTARPIAIPFGTTEHYGYAMCASQGQNRGFVTMETGAESVQFISEAPKFI